MTKLIVNVIYYGTVFILVLFLVLFLAAVVAERLAK